MRVPTQEVNAAVPSRVTGMLLELVHDFASATKRASVNCCSHLPVINCRAGKPRLSGEGPVMQARLC